MSNLCVPAYHPSKEIQSLDVIMSAKVITIADQANIAKTSSAIMPVINVEKEHCVMAL
jgi:hypothetical protein